MPEETMRVILEGRDMASDDINRAKGNLGALDKTADKLRQTLKRVAVVGAAAMAATAVAAVKLAVSFDTSMIRIETQVGLAREEVEKMRPAVLALAGETARAPQELAEGLLAILSAGASASEAMDILKVSAQGAAIGLGQTEDIGRVIVAALRAYSDAGLTAVQVADQLLVAIQEGAAEAPEFASALGPIIGLAAQLDISFSDLIASVATFTRLGVSANIAVTGLQGVMSMLIRPTDQSREALDSIGLSMEQLRRTAGEEGLANALGLLMERAGANVEVLAQVIPNIRALRAVMGTAGVQAEDFAQISEAVAVAQGDMAAAMEITAESAGLKFQQAMVDLQVALIEIGDRALPAVVSGLGAVMAVVLPFLDGFAKVVDVLEVLSPALITFGATILAAIVIPKIILATQSLVALSTEVIRISAGFGHMNVAMATLGSMGLPLLLGAFAAIAVVVATLLIPKFLSFGSTGDALAEQMEKWSGEVEGLRREFELLGQGTTEAELRALIQTWEEGGAQLGAFIEQVESGTHALQQQGATILDQYDIYKLLIEEVGHLTDEQEELAGVIGEKLPQSTAEALALLNDLGVTTETLNALFPELAETIGNNADELGQLAAEAAPAAEQLSDIQELVSDVAGAFDFLRSTLDALAGVETQEEARMRALISQHELAQVQIKNTALALSRDLTPAEEATIKGHDLEIDKLRGMMDELRLTRQSYVDLAVSQKGLLPVQSALVSGIDSLAYSTKVEAQMVDILTEAAQTARDLGLAPLAAVIEQQLLPSLQAVAQERGAEATLARLGEAAANAWGPLRGVLNVLTEMSAAVAGAEVLTGRELLREVDRVVGRTVTPFIAPVVMPIFEDMGGAMGRGIAEGLEEELEETVIPAFEAAFAFMRAVAERDAEAMRAALRLVVAVATDDLPAAEAAWQRLIDTAGERWPQVLADATRAAEAFGDAIQRNTEQFVKDAEAWAEAVQRNTEQFIKDAEAWAAAMEQHVEEKIERIKEKIEAYSAAVEENARRAAAAAAEIERAFDAAVDAVGGLAGAFDVSLGGVQDLLTGIMGDPGFFQRLEEAELAQMIVQIAEAFKLTIVQVYELILGLDELGNAFEAVEVDVAGLASSLVGDLAQAFDVTDERVKEVLEGFERWGEITDILTQQQLDALRDKLKDLGFTAAEIDAIFADLSETLEETGDVAEEVAAAVASIEDASRGLVSGLASVFGLTSDQVEEVLGGFERWRDVVNELAEVAIKNLMRQLFALGFSMGEIRDILEELAALADEVSASAQAAVTAAGGGIGGPGVMGPTGGGFISASLSELLAQAQEELAGVARAFTLIGPYSFTILTQAGQLIGGFITEAIMHWTKAAIMRAMDRFDRFFLEGFGEITGPEFAELLYTAQRLREMLIENAEGMEISAEMLDLILTEVEERWFDFLKDFEGDTFLILQGIQDMTEEELAQAAIQLSERSANLNKIRSIFGMAEQAMASLGGTIEEWFLYLMGVAGPPPALAPPGAFGGTGAGGPRAQVTQNFYGTQVTVQGDTRQGLEALGLSYAGS